MKTLQIEIEDKNGVWVIFEIEVDQDDDMGDDEQALDYIEKYIIVSSK